MKLKSGFVLRHVAGQHVAVPANSGTGSFAGALMLNEVAAFLWEKLQRDVSHGELVAALLDRYPVDPARAVADLDALLAQMRDIDLIEE